MRGRLRSRYKPKCSSDRDEHTFEGTTVSLRLQNPARVLPCIMQAVGSRSVQVYIESSSKAYQGYAGYDFVGWNGSIPFITFSEDIGPGMYSMVILRLHPVQYHVVEDVWMWIAVFGHESGTYIRTILLAHGPDRITRVRKKSKGKETLLKESAIAKKKP